MVVEAEVGAAAGAFLSLAVHLWAMQLASGAVATQMYARWAPAEAGCKSLSMTVYAASCAQIVCVQAEGVRGLG